MLKNYSRVRLLTDEYQSEGATKDSLGYIIEVYTDGMYEVEFSRSDGTTYAQIVAQENQLQQDEPPNLSQNEAYIHAAMKTAPLNSSSLRPKQKLIRSNK